MKKILALIITFSISLGLVFAQEAQDVNAADTENNEKYLGFINDMRAGAFFNFEPAAGELSEFVFSSIGGGTSFEAGIPLPLFSQNTVIHGLLENFGASFRMTFDGGIMKGTSIDSLFTMRYTLGAYTRIPLPWNMFSIVPEIDYGLVFNFPKASGVGAKYVESVYVDQILQLGAGVRFSHPEMLNGNLEFEFTPTYSLSPESGSSVHYIGFRLGVLYKFADRGHGVPVESNKSLQKSEPLEVKHIQLTPEMTVKKDGLSERAEKLRIDFASLAEDAEENNLKKLAKKYKGYEKEVEKIIEEIQFVDSEESLAAAEAKLTQLEGKIGNLEEVEEEAEVELDIAVTEMAAKTGHAALIHHPDGTYTIAIPPLTFEANTTGLIISDQNKKSLDTLIEVLTTDERIAGMIVSVFGYINPDSRSEFWTEEEKELARGRAETIANYLIENGCNHRVDSHAGEGYTKNAVFNRRVEFLVHN
ncbi:hypothetical protein [Treponema sp.]|uniref:hypothetical protein n=1 Tax=Treponema sp. TaxID=166 RepID=UPI00298D959C|nr:hypothetical protein [Treponema sp.]MCQ2241107.1 hypothetical protein [Treponema sp.]